MTFSGKSRRSRLFYQYLVSYLCILLVPLLLLSILLYQYIFGILRSNIQENNETTLTKALSLVEAHIHPITSLENRFYLKHLLTPFSLEDDPLRGINLQKDLRHYLKTMPFVYDIAYFQADDDYIITSRSSCLKQRFFEQMYLYPDFNYAKFLSAMKAHPDGSFIGTQKVLLPSGDQKNFLTYVQPFLHEGTSRGIIYLIDSDSFQKIIPFGPESKNHTSAILNSDGTLLLSNGDNELIQNFLASSSTQDSQENYITIDHQKYMFTHITSEDTMWTYITLIPKNDITGQIYHIFFFMGMICMIAVVSGLFGIFFVMKYNYTPIKNLETISNRIMENQTDGNEIDHVANVLDFLNKQNLNLTKNDAIKTLATRERFIIKLISGQYPTSTIIHEKAQLVDLSLNCSYYQVAVCNMRTLRPGDHSNLEDLFIESRPNGTDILIHFVPESRHILLLIGYDTLESTRLEQYLCDMSNLLKADFGLESIIGLGNPADSVSRIPTSYQEAIDALEYRIVFYDRQLIPYARVQNRHSSDFSFSPSQLSALIESKNIQGMDDFLDDWQNEMRTCNASAQFLHKQCNELLYAIEHIIRKLNRDYFAEEPLYSNIASVLQYDNIQELAQIVHLVGCDIVNQFNELSGRSIIDSLVQYVKENCYSCDFSTTKMAEDFQMSLPYLSQYFKAHHGQNLLDYVTELKVERAKSLLRESNLPIREIAEQVGYYNANSFNRRFKQITGLTPGEYRRGE